MFTGASQFALVGVVAAGGAPLSGAATALLLGTRNTLYGLRMAPLLQWRGWRRAGAAHVLIDESTAMAVNRGSTEAARARLPRRPASPSSSCGTSPPPSEHSQARRSVTRGPSASTPLSPRRSWPCCGPGSRTGATCSSACWPRRWPCRWCRSPPPACPCSPPVASPSWSVSCRDAADPTEVPGAARRGGRARADVDRDPAGLRRLLPAQAGRPVPAGAGAEPPDRRAGGRPHPGGAARRARRRAGVLRRARARAGRAGLGLGFAVVALLLRAPFLVVVVGASSWRRSPASSDTEPYAATPAVQQAGGGVRRSGGSADRDRAPRGGDGALLRRAAP